MKTSSVAGITDLDLLDEAEIHQLIRSGMSLPEAFGDVALLAGRAGERPSRQKGHGLDFDDMRIYQSGDDHRRIDWRASARSQHTLLRTYQMETRQSVCLLIDRQASMRLGSRHRLKVTQAVRFALWTAGLHLQAGREIAGVLLDSPCQWFPPAGDYGTLLRFARVAASACPPLETEKNIYWKKLLANLVQELSPGSRVVLVSDFFHLGEQDKRLLQTLGHLYDVQAVQITDPLEKHFLTAPGLLLRWGNYSVSSDDQDQVRLERDRQQQHRKFLLHEFKRAGISYREMSVSVDDFSREITAGSV